MTQLIKWSAKYNVGNFIIDHQHKRLVQLINNLNEVVHQKTPSPDILEIYYQDVANYINFHFTTEENVMFTCHYSALAEHKVMHQNFKNAVNKLKQQTLDGQDPTGKKLCNFLKDWLLTHIAVEDQKIVNELVEGDYLPSVRKLF